MKKSLRLLSAACLVFLIFLFASFSSAHAGCTTKLVHAGESMTPPAPAAGEPATITFQLYNDSGCDAVNHRLSFHSVMPATPECLSGNYSGSNPTFSISAGATGPAVAEIPAAPPAGCKVYFDILDASGRSLTPLPAGRLYEDFNGGTGPGSPCAGAAQPSIKNARLAHLGNGQVLVSADIISIPPAPPAVPGPALPLTAMLELNNGNSIPMEPLASGGYGAQGKGKIIGQNDYRITVFNGCFTAVFSFVKGVASSYLYGTSRLSSNCKFLACKADPVTTYTGNFTDTLTDAAVAGIGDADLLLQRSYNSSAAQTDSASVYEFAEYGDDGEKVEGPPQYFGTGWSSNLDVFLLKLGYAPVYEGVQILFPDGHTQNFDKDGSSYKPSTPDNFDELTKEGSAFVLKRKSSLEKWRFGSDGKLLEISDKNGNTVTCSYSGGLLSKISSGSRSITFSHDSKGHIVKAELPENITISYEYKDGLLAAMTDGRGNKTEYSYDGNKQLTEITTPLGTPAVRMSYDDRYRVSSQTVGENELYAFAYQGEDAAESTTITDSYGNATVQKHDEEGRQTEIIHPDGTTEKFEHDERNNRTYYQDPAGGEYRYTYDARGNLLTLDGPLGLRKEWEYNAKNLVAAKKEKVDASRDREFTFEYDDNGNLSKFCLPLGDCGSITYNPNGLPVQMTDLRGSVTVNEYDAEGDLVSVTDPEGAKTQFAHDGLGRVIGKTKPLGNAWHYSYDQNSNLIAVDGPLGFHIGYVYDPNNNLIQSLDPNGGTSRYTYTPSGSLSAAQNQLGFITAYAYGLMNERTGKTDAEGRTWSYVYNNMLRVTDISGPLGWRQSFVYNPLGLVTDAADPEGRVKHVEYDALGRPLAVTKNYVPGAGESSDTNVTTRFTYDLLGNRLAVKDPEGYEFTAAYDLQNRLVKKKDAEGYEWEYSYDPMGNLLAELNPRGYAETYAYSPANRLQSVTNPEGHVQSLAYNKNGRLTSVKDPLGIITAYSYDELDRKTAKIRNWQPSAAPDNQTNVTTKFAYDLAGNLRFVTNPLNYKAEIRYDAAHRKTELINFEGGSTRFEYDKVSNLLKVTDAEGNATTYKVDDLDRRVSLTNAENETTGYAYDLVGNRTKLIEPDSTVTLYEFDGVYRLNKVHENWRPDQQPGNDVNVLTQYGYDRRGLLTSIINANGAETRFEHNGVAELVKETDPLGKEWEYAYDGNRNRVRRKDAKGELTEYGFYPDDMLEKISYADGSSVSYEYDANNNRTGMTDKLGKTAWSYDPLNRIIGQADPFDRALASRYDADSNRIGMIYPDGNQVAYEYSPNSWLKRMIVDTVGAKDFSPLPTEYSRDLVGNVTRIVNPNQTETTVAYDKVYRTLERVNRQTTKGGKINSAYRYSYDEVGNITETVNQYGWRQPSVVTETYGYDGLHRLTDFALFPLKNNGGSLQTYYSYDPAGNRLSWETSDDLQTNTPDDGFFRTYEYNEANQMLGMNHDADKKNKDYAYLYRFDENGNRINRQLADAHGPQYGVDYSYDPENRLVAAQDYQLVGSGRNGGQRIDRAFTTLEYDGGGRRLVQHYDPKHGGIGVDKRDEYVFDGLDPVAEYDMLNGQRTDYYRGAGGHLALMHSYKGGTQGQMYWYHYNHKGDVVGLTKQNGNAHHNYRYEPYGAVLPENGNFTDPHNHYTLTGKEFDENTGLVWFGARHYEPETGVWMGQDVYRGRLSEPGSLHRFGYVSNNPVNGWDWYGFRTALLFYSANDASDDPNSEFFKNKARSYAYNHLLNTDEWNNDEDEVYLVDASSYENWEYALSNFKDIDYIAYFGHGYKNNTAPSGKEPKGGLYIGTNTYLVTDDDPNYDSDTDYLISSFPKENVLPSAKIYLFACHSGAERGPAKQFAEHFGVPTLGAQGGVNFFNNGNPYQPIWHRDEGYFFSWKWYNP
jgi:RHS repeat-associated protein